jgi:anaerobic selenocysteine-containing dehydrogenase
LLSPASPKTINTMFAEFDGPEPVVRVNPADAAARGIEDGTVVRVYNAQGEIVLTMRVDPDLRPGVVTVPKGLWCNALPCGLTANVLVPDTLSDLAGGATFNDARVEVSPLDS